MFERFTDKARRVVVLAQEEARILDHNYVGTEHLLLGLIREEEGVAARALVSLDISLEDVRSQVRTIIGEGTAAPAGHIPFTPRTKKALELALREALQLGHNYIGTEHILLGLVREGEGVAAQVLGELGAEPDRIRGVVIELLAAYSGTGAPSWTYEEPKQRRAFRTRPRFRRTGADGPDCPTCHVLLEGSTGVRRVTATGGEEREILVVYCRSCGRALGTIG